MIKSQAFGPNGVDKSRARLVTGTQRSTGWDFAKEIKEKGFRSFD
jgi:hypothetical protein